MYTDCDIEENHSGCRKTEERPTAGTGTIQAEIGEFEIGRILQLSRGAALENSPGRKPWVFPAISSPYSMNRFVRFILWRLTSAAERSFKQRRRVLMSLLVWLQESSFAAFVRDNPVCYW